MSQQLSYEEFESTFTEDRPESAWPDSLRALWFAGKDEWDASHDIAQEMHTNLGSWIHAYLHRVEGAWDIRVLFSFNILSILGSI